MNRPEINVTPLIDVLLVLLIIFMVVTPTKPSSFDTKIPSEPKDGGEPHPHTIVVSIENDGRYAVNETPLDATVDSPAAMIESLKLTFRLRAQNLVDEKTVFIKAPKSLDYGSVARAVDAVKIAGAFPIGLQIDDLKQ
ncbi:MAG: ExbD/TolR family protein [Blastocatellia bacterium]